MKNDKELKSILESLLIKTKKENKIKWEYLNSNDAIRCFLGTPISYMIHIYRKHFDDKTIPCRYNLTIQTMPDNRQIYTFQNEEMNDYYISIILELFKIVYDDRFKQTLNNLTNYLDNL